MGLFSSIKEKTKAAGAYIKAEEERYEAKQKARADRELATAQQRARIAKQEAIIAKSQPRHNHPLGPLVFGGFSYAGKEMSYNKKRPKRY